jgi:hypothetical protein
LPASSGATARSGAGTGAGRSTTMCFRSVGWRVESRRRRSFGRAGAPASVVMSTVAPEPGDASWPGASPASEAVSGTSLYTFGALCGAAGAAASPNKASGPAARRRRLMTTVGPLPEKTAAAVNPSRGAGLWAVSVSGVGIRPSPNCGANRPWLMEAHPKGKNGDGSSRSCRRTAPARHTCVQSANQVAWHQDRPACAVRQLASNRAVEAGLAGQWVVACLAVSVH